MNLRTVLVSLTLLYLAGCAGQPVEPTAMEKAEPASQPTPERPVPVKKAPPPVIILTSERIPPYTEVANRLQQRLGDRASQHYLKQGTAEFAASVSGSGEAQFVTIGLAASRQLRQLDRYQQVFCQVFNYTEYELIGERSKGVSMLPGATELFRAWRALSPELHTVAVISGPGLEPMLRSAVDKAAAEGVTLRHVVVQSDKEFVYSYKQLAGEVDGYWLIPDNRILSVRAIREVMNFSVRNARQVAVFSRELLRLGGLFSVSSSYDEIAEKVIERLEQSAHRDSIPGPLLQELGQARLTINPVMVERFNLRIPEQYREYAGAPTTE